MTLDFLTNKEITVLSAHLDDAVWSLGGLLPALLNSGYIVKVINVFSQSSFIYGGLEDSIKATTIRKKEDYKTLKRVGINGIEYIDLPEGVLRGKKLSEIFNSNFQPSKSLTKKVTEEISTRISGDCNLLVPAAFGYNIDHLTLRKVAPTLSQRVMYYEDMPYASRKDRNSDVDSFLKSLSYRRISIAATSGMIDAHLDFYNMYISQRKDKHIVEISKYLKEYGYGIWVK